MNIVVLDKCTITNGDISLSEIDALGSVKYYDLVPSENIAEICQHAEIIICNKAIITRSVIENCPKLRYIGLFATGYNNVDLDAASEHGVLVANVPGYSTNSVAQMVFSYILEFAGNLSKYNRSVHEGGWLESKGFSYFPFPITEVQNKTLGIFGFGSIGKAVARIGEAFHMKVIICTKPAPSDGCYEVVEMDELFARSDFLTFHCPLTEQTKLIVNSGTLSLMKPTAYLINTSRGGVVNEDDLAAALNEGKIAGAAIDVLTVEPMQDNNPLYTAKNCIITPHIAWAPIETRRRLITLVAQNITMFLQGTPHNIVNSLK